MREKKNLTKITESQKQNWGNHADTSITRTDTGSLLNYLICNLVQ